MSGQIRVGVVGVGNFGARHAEKYAKLANADLVGVTDANETRGREVAAHNGADYYDDLDSLISRVDAVSIAVPTAHHYDVGRRFIEAGIHVLMEKPITDRADTAQALAELADKKSVVLQVGHIERFSPTFEALHRIIDKPLYVESNRISVFTGRSLDVNVVLDLMIHDIDLLTALVASPVETVDAVGAPVVGEHEDIANSRLMFANGCVANITASRISHKVERNLRIFQPHEYTVADLHNHRIIRFREKTNPEPGELFPVQKSEETIETWDSLEREVAAFLESVSGGTAPRVTGWQGAEAVKTAMQIQESFRAHRARLGL